MVWLSSWATTRARLIALMLGSFGALLLCAILCGELLGLGERPDGSTALDSSITSWMVAHRNQGWTTLAHALSTLGSQTVLLPLTAAVALALLARRRFTLAALLITAWGGALLLYSLTKYFVHRPRPPSHIWLTDVGKTTSFPSGHATQSLATLVAFGLVGMAWISKPRWPALLLPVVLAAGVGWSRVYLGVHWTSDVLAGWLIGAVWVTIVLWLAGIELLIERRRPDGRPSGSSPD
ncbi:MAG TPA: phosphatase PAP2 family protein [Solirubrobacteraceae bacterium]